MTINSPTSTAFNEQANMHNLGSVLDGLHSMITSALAAGKEQKVTPRPTKGSFLHVTTATSPSYGCKGIITTIVEAEAA